MAASLVWDETDKAFILETADKELAATVRAEGWARTRLGGKLKAGHHALFTREPYAALPFIRFTPEGTPARNMLVPLHTAYEQSMAKASSFKPEVPPDLPDYLEPRPFQRAGVWYALDRPHPLIGDDMGTGKTAQGIMVANCLRAEKILVVCPANARLQWREQIQIWSTIPRVSTYPILKSADGVSPFANYTMISYNLLQNPAIFEALCHQEWDVLIIDEAHYLKTSTSKRTEAVFGALSDKHPVALAPQAKKIIAMTGTPLPNRPRECYMLARNLAWDSIDWLSEDAFIRRYNPSATMESGHVVEYSSRLAELRCRLRCNFMVRRRKKDVLDQLPEKQCELTYVEPNGAIKKALKAESLLDFDVDKFEDMDMQARGHIAAVRHEMGIAKVPRVIEHVNMLLDGGLEKVFVVAFHKEVMRLLYEAFQSHGVAIIRGGQTNIQRDREKYRFIKDPECRIMLGQLQAAGESLDGMQAVCRHGVFAEASWVPKDNDQIMDRIHRLGQVYGVFWQFLVAPGSLDEKILGRAIGKGLNIRKTLDGD